MAPEAIAKMARDRWFEVVRYVYSFAPRINTNNSKKYKFLFQIIHTDESQFFRAGQF